MASAVAVAELSVAVAGARGQRMRWSIMNAILFERLLLRPPNWFVSSVAATSS